ncbi:hypothetical protein BHM03_00006417, partial [Ensete ventricosum]
NALTPLPPLRRHRRRYPCASNNYERLAVDPPYRRPAVGPPCERCAASNCTYGQHFYPQASPLRATAPVGGYRPLRAPLASLTGWPWS